MNRVEIAVSQFKAGLSCPQSVVAAYADSLGVDMDCALRIATGFGGGVGRTGGTCGAVTGAIMVLGMKYGGDEAEDRDKTIAMVRQFLSRFQERNHSLACRGLLDCDISTAQGWQTAKESGLFGSICPSIIRSAAELLEDLLTES